MEQATPPTTVSVCSRKLTIKLNSLESIWYCVFVVVVTLFLCLDATRHYVHYDKLEWPQGKMEHYIGVIEYDQRSVTYTKGTGREITYSTSLYNQEQWIWAIHDVVFHRLMRMVSEEVHAFYAYRAVNSSIKCVLCNSAEAPRSNPGQNA